jgi:hypothetical protein
MLTVKHMGPKDDFVELPSEIFTSANLTPTAIKLLGYLHVYASVPGWEFRLEHMHKVVAGESALRAARKCLRENGYLQESVNKGGVYKNIDMVFSSYPQPHSQAKEQGHDRS